MKKESSRRLKQWLYALLLLSMPKAEAQTSCPPNLDFEAGSFTHWQCFSGFSGIVGGQNQLTLSPDDPQPDRHVLYSAQASAGETDPFGGFPVVCPNGSGYSVRLGNSFTGRGAERIAYTFTIPADRNEYSIVYQYAVVLQDPTHAPAEQPRFTARVFDVSANRYINCASFNHVASADIPGFQSSPLNSSVKYKGWTPVTINLSGYAGKTIMLEFSTADCTLGAHFGYAYVDVNAGCQPPVTGAAFCAGAASATLQAPHGYQRYRWLSESFSQVLGSQPSLTITPPAAGARYALEITPFAGQGCLDTVYATLSSLALPPADAGGDPLFCAGDSTSLGSQPVQGLEYSWLPQAGLSNAFVARPRAAPLQPTHYALTVRDPLTGCTRSDTVLAAPQALPSAAAVLQTPSVQCLTGNRFRFAATNPGAATYSWQPSAGTAGTGDVFEHHFPAAGEGLVTVVATSALGCRNTATLSVRINPLPEGTIQAARPLICEGYPTLLSATGGSSYQWLRDGQPLGVGATLAATLPGRYGVVVTDSNGCTSETPALVLSLQQKPLADFSWTNYCLSEPVRLRSSTALGNSPLRYRWQAEGIESTGAELLHRFAASGPQLVRLTVTPEACPGLETTVVKTVMIEAPVPGMRYAAVNTLPGQPVRLQARTPGHSYQWSAPFSLSDAASATPLFTGEREQELTVRYRTPSGCTTTDTVLVRVFRQSDVLVPTAFTPNGDGRNDRLRPVLVGLRTLRFFRIYNRWGNLVFESRGDGGWDGSFRGQAQPSGGFVWEAEALDNKGEVLVRKGSFVLVR
jgi:gliding motility-associated-like protein